MPTATASRLIGWRILGFGKHPEIAAAVQEKLRGLGFQATNLVLSNDDAGDAQLIAELKRAEYDGVAIGGYINGQDAVNFPVTAETTTWFNRVLNLIHANAPSSKIILCARRRTLCLPLSECSGGTRRPEQVMTLARQRLAEVASKGAGRYRPDR